MTDTEWAKPIFESAIAAIVEMVTPLLDDDATDEQQEEAREMIQQDPLSIQVRGGWCYPGAQSEGAEEFEILLATGGPAVRIMGELDQYHQPSEPELQVQDWFKPWTSLALTDEQDEALRTYCAEFWFGG